MYYLKENMQGTDADSMDSNNKDIMINIISPKIQIVHVSFTIQITLNLYQLMVYKVMAPLNAQLPLIHYN